jgi:hypothetical protein
MGYVLGLFTVCSASVGSVLPVCSLFVHDLFSFCSRRAGSRTNREQMGNKQGTKRERKGNKTGTSVPGPTGHRRKKEERIKQRRVGVQTEKKKQHNTSATRVRTYVRVCVGACTCLCVRADIWPDKGCGIYVTLLCVFELFLILVHFFVYMLPLILYCLVIPVVIQVNLYIGGRYVCTIYLAIQRR